MCSIAGSKTSDEVARMLGMMKHRAPDDEGIVNVGNMTMGMGRLSIIDLKSKGLCPYAEDGYALSFNGEIYNYLEIRKELAAKGWVFRTNSDTEVLLKSWREWGVKCLDKFNGMFAFAIYDGKKIFLARDIAGEKPLYYTAKPFRFASEAKALGFDCEEFPPASYGIYDFKNFVIKPYWTLKRRDINIKTAEEELEWLLEDSVKLRTRSDVPYGLYYSRGIDSSLLATFHDFRYKFTYRDADYAKEFKKIFPKILWHLDYPIDSFSPFGLWKLAEMASQKVKVVLSGEGADELFGGYARYVLPEFNYQARKQFPSYPSMFQPAMSVQESGWNEFNGNLRKLLRMGDRVSSAFGLENRCPFLDRRIIEFAFSLPNELKINGVETKVILQNILKRRNPSYRPIEKKGLYCSVNKWIGSKNVFDKTDYMELQYRIAKTFKQEHS